MPDRPDRGGGEARTPSGPATFPLSGLLGWTETKRCLDRELPPESLCRTRTGLRGAALAVPLPDDHSGRARRIWRTFANRRRACDWTAMLNVSCRLAMLPAAPSPDRSCDGQKGRRGGILARRVCLCRHVVMKSSPHRMMAAMARTRAVARLERRHRVQDEQSLRDAAQTRCDRGATTKSSRGSDRPLAIAAVQGPAESCPGHGL